MKKSKRSFSERKLSIFDTITNLPQRKRKIIQNESKEMF